MASRTLRPADVLHAADCLDELPQCSRSGLLAALGPRIAWCEPEALEKPAPSPVVDRLVPAKEP